MRCTWCTAPVGSPASGDEVDFSRFSESEASTTLFRYRQIESTNRVVLDVERLTFRGLMPPVFAGLDVSLLRGDIGRSTTIVPVAGIGMTNGHPWTRSRAHVAYTGSPRDS